MAEIEMLDCRDHVDPDAEKSLNEHLRALRADIGESGHVAMQAMFDVVEALVIRVRKLEMNLEQTNVKLWEHETRMHS